MSGLWLFPDDASRADYAPRAVFSPCRRWRYELQRRWGSGSTVLFVMLNPSTADERVNDPTITRCIGFAKRWGFGALSIGNLFAWRSTDPRALHDVEDPIGPENDAAIERMARSAHRIVVAWGGNAEKIRPGRALEVLRLLGGEVQALYVNADGSPKHPLYVASATEPALFGMKGRV